MREHLAFVKSHPKSTNYHSPLIQTEFIQLMASAVRQNLLQSIRKAKYYGLMFHSTPDLAYHEQLSEVVRCIDIDFVNKTVKVKKSFLGFNQISRKDAEGLVEVILDQLEKDEMELMGCRSQCYDNAAIMSGHVSGVQKRIIDKNHFATYNNCDNHSLNLVGFHAAREDPIMVTFFGSIQTMYVFFSNSTQRWEKLKEAVHVVVKSESETRWSARVEAVIPINNQLAEMVKLYHSFIDDQNQSNETKNETKQIVNRMLTYEFLFLV